MTGVQTCALPIFTANPFGPGDNFDPEDAHVIGALMTKMQRANSEGSGVVEIWGTGSPRRDFIYIDDLATAAVWIMERYSADHPINLTAGTDISIQALARTIAEVVGFRGELRFDATRPDGMPLKILDPRALAALGWRPRVSLREALDATFAWTRRAPAGEIHAV